MHKKSIEIEKKSAKNNFDLKKSIKNPEIENEFVQLKPIEI